MNFEHQRTLIDQSIEGPEQFGLDAYNDRTASNIRLDNNPSRNTVMTNFGQDVETLSAMGMGQNLNPNISVDADFDIKKNQINKPSSKASSSFRSDSVVAAGEEMVCRICLGTEEEGTPGEDG